MSNSKPTLTLADAIDRFLADPTTGTGHTVRTYATSLKRLLAYIESAGQDPVTLPANVVDVQFTLDWVAWLLDDQVVSERTLLTYLAGFSRFVRFLHTRDLSDIDADAVLRIQSELKQVRRVHKPPVRHLRLPSEDDVAALVRAARSVQAIPDDERSELRRLRDIAVLELLRSSGIRVSELVGLRRRDIERATKTPALKSKTPGAEGEAAGRRGGRIRVMGKGRRERWAYADADAWAALDAYLLARAPLDGATGRSLGGLPIFARHDRPASDRASPLSTRSVQYIIERLAGLAGLTDQVLSPHSLRHYFATRVLRATGNLAVVQDLLDHRSPTTTRVYAEVDETQKEEAHQLAFGRKTS
jgi:site-specific recombinase XerD